MTGTGGPLDGNAIVLAAAKASVSGERLPELVDRAQATLETRRDEYGRRYECVHEENGQVVFFVEEGHWADLGAELGLERREWAALRRAHAEHLRQLGGELGRRAEFETALDVREVVVIG
ncbi:hypothetical protein [Natronomonas salsuginis]|jgi:hypothetical protein|uniref:DUF8048 domain-containing protein n=1 Tax=Natronomonas salsuginis TaxID=2217661 RepID=A0A4U5J8M3_9EURY|nr:hypothetical protein [Natronomonas salsuginis]TKR25422.1 hypothetical protein DM868_08325 [Natronomonas salsuginis]